MKLSMAAFILFLPLCFGESFNDQRFKQLVAKMENDVVGLAREVEGLYEGRCDGSRLSECSKGNYDDCLSVYPSQTCPGGPHLHVPSCGDGETCSALYDFTVSAVTIPGDLADGPDGNPTDPQVIETVCFTRDLDEWFIDKREEDKEYWRDFGVEPSAMFFGSRNGAFRIYPARHTENCGSYDPRLRPWYVAASSGPKNVIMVLDTSGSMKGIRLELMKEAASRVISTLAVGDRVAIVPFATEASVIADDDGYLYTATDANKAAIISRIKGLKALGSTNILDAFEKAFDVLDKSSEVELHVDCNTAILFLTDGEMTEPKGVDGADVIEYVKQRMDMSSAKLSGNKIVLFSYSVSEDSKVHSFPSTLACSTELGVWSRVQNDAQIVDSLSSYYQLFALGLGSDSNANFTAWVEPYAFATGGVSGTTVSSPIYDRSKTPHLFLGVVGIDFLMESFEIALDLGKGGGNVSEESIKRVVLASTATCPSLELETCELESYRRQGGGNGALCTGNCSESDFVQIEEQKCSTVSDYPRDLFANYDNKGVPYVDRVCCEIGESGPSDACPARSPWSPISAGAIAGIAVGGLLALGLVAFGISKWRKRVPIEKSPTLGGEKAVALPSAVPPPQVNPHYRASAPIGQMHV